MSLLDTEITSKPLPDRPQPRRRRLTLFLLGVTVLLTVSLVIWLTVPGAQSWARAAFDNGPTPGVAEQSHRILPALTAPEGGSYEFIAYDDRGEPITYSPCRELRVVVNLSRAPLGSMQVVEHAVAEIQDATGLRMVVEGRTTEVYSPQRPDYQPDRYGDRYAPILIDWVGSTIEPRFRSEAIAVGGSSWRTTANGTSFTSGAVALSNDFFNLENADFGYPTLLHELGHVVGLDHVESRQEVMTAAESTQDHFGVGDRAGLARLGSGQCNPSL